MGVIDLKERMTSDWSVFQQFYRSSDSLIFVSDVGGLPTESCITVDLTVGESWYDHQTQSSYEIGDSGLYLGPSSSAVIDTQQKLALPNNVSGIVTGKGSFIFKAVLVAPGKIDPGFQGNLRIGLFNAGVHRIVLKKGEPFCSCLFMTLESGFEVPMRQATIPPLKKSRLPWRMRASDFIARYWDKIVPITISSLALLIAILNYIK